MSAGNSCVFPLAPDPDSGPWSLSLASSEDDFRARGLRARGELSKVLPSEGDPSLAPVYIGGDAVAEDKLKLQDANISHVRSAPYVSLSNCADAIAHKVCPPLTRKPVPAPRARRTLISDLSAGAECHHQRPESLPRDPYVPAATRSGFPRSGLGARAPPGALDSLCLPSLIQTPKSPCLPQGNPHECCCCLGLRDPNSWQGKLRMGTSGSGRPEPGGRVGFMVAAAGRFPILALRGVSPECRPETLAQASEFISEARKTGTGVLVHCLWGVSRAPTMVRPDAPRCARGSHASNTLLPPTCCRYVNPAVLWSTVLCLASGLLGA